MLCYTGRRRLSARNAALGSIMLCFLLSRNSVRVVAQVSRAGASLSRSFARSNPTCGEESDSVVTYTQLTSMLSSGDVQLFDVRNPDEYQAGYIADAVNTPLDTLEDSLKLAPQQFQEKFGVSAPGKYDDDIVFYCRTGKRSTSALGIAHQLGFCRARHFKGGYTEWEKQQGNKSARCQ
ncbi:thiosulfate:glutathione sulfurtransferase [Brachionichthys hirsutus]|uniref:thiosulfate:glutathione sulfurtransferase n=1 Tax=Brachionichthys hirsutus TaxID=412623 RepID=UPI003604D298